MIETANAFPITHRPIIQSFRVRPSTQRYLSTPIERPQLTIGRFLTLASRRQNPRLLSRLDLKPN
jgi:hypothetical protein